jgi:integrase
VGADARGGGVRHIRFPDARHTWGTLTHLEDVPIAVISAWLGHASKAFTMATYVHSQPDALSTAARSFARAVQYRAPVFLQIRRYA